MKAPGRVARVVIRPVPGVVIPARAVDNRAAVIIAAVIAGRVADVDDLRSHIVNLDVGDVVMRIRGRNLVDSVRNIGCDAPRARGAVRDVPDAVVTRIVKVAVPKNRGRGVLCVFDTNILDRGEVRLAVVFDAEGRVIAFDRGGLWNRVIQHRLARLRRTGHLAQYGTVDRILRDVAEWLRQLVVWHVHPFEVTLYALAAVPASRQQYIVSLRRKFEKHVAVGICHVKQIHPFDRCPGRFTVRDNQFGRLGRDDDANIVHGSAVVLGRFDKLSDIVRNLPCAGPGTGDCRSLVPGIAADIEVQILAAPDDQKRRIDNALVERTFDRLEPRVSIDRNQQRRSRGQHDIRRLMPETGLPGSRGLGLQVREQLVDRDREARSADFGFDEVCELLHLIVTRVGKTDISNRHVANNRGSRIAIRIKPGLEPDSAEHRHVIGCSRLDGNCGASFEAVARKFFYLRLINENYRSVIGFEFLRPAEVLGLRIQGNRPDQGQPDCSKFH